MLISLAAARLATISCISNLIFFCGFQGQPAKVNFVPFFFFLKQEEVIPTPCGEQHKPFVARQKNIWIKRMKYAGDSFQVTNDDKVSAPPISLAVLEDMSLCWVDLYECRPWSAALEQKAWKKTTTFSLKPPRR